MRRHWTAAAALFIAMLICRTTVADEPAAVQIVLPTPVAQYVIEEVSTARSASSPPRSRAAGCSRPSPS